jgi:hypothetical protein
MWRSVFNIFLFLIAFAFSGNANGNTFLLPPDSLYTDTSAVHRKVVVEYTETDLDSARMEKVKREYCANMKLPEGFEKAFLLSLLHYPELKNTHIRCVQRKRFVPLTTMPTFFSTLFHKKENRRYLIIISKKSKPILDSITLRFIPFNAQVGVLGHELAHVSFFTKQNFWGVMRVARGNLSKKYLDKMEFATDQSTIDHGLGWQLLSWSEYSREILAKKYFKDIPDWRKIDFEKIDPPLSERYMHPWTIKKRIKENPKYKGTWENQ